LSLRRYRAERLLRDEFEALRGRVIATVRGRLRAGGVTLDAGDLESCYAQAWQGLYTAVLDGQQVANPSGWLALVTYRRAIDEHRAHRPGQCGVDLTSVTGGELTSGDPLARTYRRRPSAGERSRTPSAGERDLAAQLDDRARLRQLFEGMRGRLSARERQAATLCYLQGLSRSQAAARMGVSEARMRKLMEGRGPGSPGVAGKVGALVETIRAGGWCEEQGSLMRGFAYGILDPQGERYRLALIHRSECPACRAYVLSLRGLAAVLPPIPSLLHLALGAGASAGAGAGVGGGSGAVAGTGAGVRTGMGAAAPASSGAGGALSASGATGASATGGGWLLAGGPAGAKLAVGCLLALGVGAGCVALGGHPDRTRAPAHRRHSAREADARGSASGREADEAPLSDGRLRVGGPSSEAANAAVRARTAPTPITTSAQAGREFGPEQEQAGSEARSSTPAGRATAKAKAASADAAGARAAERLASTRASVGSTAPPGRSSSGVSAAQREFAPG
jgi:RNA polymerase sigma factor (sigma-70 family)